MRNSTTVALCEDVHQMYAKLPNSHSEAAPPSTMASEAPRVHETQNSITLALDRRVHEQSDNSWRCNFHYSSPRPPTPKQDDSTKLFSTRRWRATVVEFRVWWIFVDSPCFLWTRRGRASVVEFRVLHTRVTSGAHRGRELL